MEGCAISTILIADDAAFMRAMLKQILEERGYNVVGEATNGHDAVKKYTALRPDLVTMDITMPEMDGVSALKEIIKLDAEAKVMMCSAIGQKDLIIEAVKSGAKDFVVKPYQKERLLEAVENLLEPR